MIPATSYSAIPEKKGPPLQDICAQVLANERQRYARDQTTGRWYQRQKRTQKHQYARMRARREPFPKATGKPWNDDITMQLFVCDSVRTFLAGGGA